MAPITKERLEPWEHLVAGTLAGLVSTASLYPLDLIKSRYQVNEQYGRGRPYKLHVAFRTLVRNEGFLGLYQGLPSALSGSGMSWGGYFYFYEHAKARWQSHSEMHPTLKHLASACESGAIMVFLTNPIWLIKTRMQLQNRKASQQTLETAEATTIRPYRGMFDAVSTIVREEGPLALYKGTVPALLLVSHGAIQFAVYEWLKDHTPAYLDNKQLSPIHSLPMGAVSKVVATLVTYPLQVIKTRIQQRNLDVISNAQHAARGASFIEGTEHRYSGVIDCIKKTFRYEGIYGFYKGCIPNALRVAPSAAITFLMYELIADLLRQRKRPASTQFKF